MPSKKENQIWVRKFSSFGDAERFDDEYYAAMSHEKRVGLMQHLREIYGKIDKDHNVRSGRLLRVVKILQQT